MSLDRPQRYYTRTDLFLVRIWTRGPVAGGDDGGEGTARPEWRGQVQRAGEEEAYNFNNWQGLADLLLAMISINKRR